MNELRRAVFHVYVRVAERAVYGGCGHTRFAARRPQNARQLYQYDDLGLAVLYSSTSALANTTLSSAAAAASATMCISVMHAICQVCARARSRARRIRVRWCAAAQPFAGVVSGREAVAGAGDFVHSKFCRLRVVIAACGVIASNAN